MAKEATYRGISYVVRSTGQERLQWEIRPPSGIKELLSQSGNAAGPTSEAEAATKHAIDHQTGHSHGDVKQ